MVIGSTVNIASRLESLAKMYGVDCLVTQATVRLLPESFMFKELACKPLRGISETITPFWLLPTNA